MSIITEDCRSCTHRANLTRSILLLILSTALLTTVQAANMVDIDITCNGQHDTIWTGENATFDIWFENDIYLGGFSTGFVIWSDDGADWQWLGVSGYGTSGAVTVEPGSRLYPPEAVLLYSGLMVGEADMDGISADSLLLGGVTIPPDGGLPPGPIEKMMSVHFVAGPESETIMTMCFDSAKVGWAGDFVFQDMEGDCFVPAVAWSYGGRCWPVKRSANSPPVFVNCPPGATEIPADGLFEYSFEAIDPNEDPLVFNIADVSGAGDATIDSYAGVLHYTPALEDTLSEVFILVEVCDEEPLCEFCEVMIIVTPPAPEPDRGDANDDGDINVGDAVYLINYVFKNGNPPPTEKAGDANCDGDINVGDAVYLINFVFKGGFPPGCVGACCDPMGICLMTTEFGCLINEGVFYGEGTFCETVCCSGDCCEITLTPTPPTWIPEGRAAVGTSTGDPGNSVTYTATITKGAPRVIRFMLTDVSDEPGICLNFGDESTSDKDLKFIQTPTVNPTTIFSAPSADGQTIQTKAPVVSAVVTVTCYDYGAYGKIQACCLKDDECEAYSEKHDIPVDENDNYVADAAAQNTGPGGSSAAIDDNDNTPAGDGTAGDNIPRYEEYRGFMVQDVHTRLNVSEKDVFVRNIDVTDAGPSGYLTTTTLTAPVHVIKSTEWLSVSRVINWKYETADLPTFQTAVKVTNGGTHANGYWGLAVSTTPWVPNKLVSCEVFVTTIKSGDALSSAIDATTTTIPIGNTSGWRSSGSTRIGSEQITYTDTTGTALTGATRGANGSTAAAHAAGAKVDYFLNPVNFIKRVFAHEAGHHMELEDTPTPPTACDGTGNHIMSEYSCKGGTLGAGFWSDFTGTASAITGEYRVND